MGKMKFTTFERLVLGSVLPKEGNYTTLKIVRELKENLSFSEKEFKELKMKKNEDGSLSWEKIDDKSIEVGDKALEVIKSALENLEKSKKLNNDLMPLYERFIL